MENDISNQHRIQLDEELKIVLCNVAILWTRDGDLLFYSLKSRL